MKKNNLKLLSLGLLSAFLLAGCGAKDNTPLPKTLVKFAPSLAVSTVYNVSANDGSGKQYLSFAPAVSSSLIVTVSARGRVTALNKQTGEELWEQDLDTAIGSSATIANGKVYVGTMDGWLYALDSGNGKLVWQSRVPSSVLAAPAVNSDTVVIHTHDGSVEALSAAKGKHLWVHAGSTPDLISEGNSSPVIVGSSALVGFDSGHLAAFDLSTGRVQWERPVAIPSSGSEIMQMVDIIGTPKVQGGTAYVGTFHGNLVAVSVSDGQLYWQQPLSTYRAVALAPSNIIVTTSDGSVEAFDRQTGQQAWTQNAFNYRFTSAPAVVGQYVIVGDYDGYAHWLSLSDGHQVAQEKVASSAIRSQPVVSNGIVYMTSADGRLIALKAKA